MSIAVVNHATTPQLLTIPEVAELLGISRVRCYEMAASGEIPSIRLSARRIRVQPAALDAWLTERARLSAGHHDARPADETGHARGSAGTGRASNTAAGQSRDVVSV
jgi:excisionase family DNA binding protein